MTETKAPVDSRSADPVDSTPLTPADQVDSVPPAPAAVRVYATLAHGTAGVMLDVGLMVLGSILVGLSAAVLLVGIGVVEISWELSTGGTFVSGVALALSGMLCLGIASESPLGRGGRLAGFGVWHLGIGLAACALLVGLAAMGIHRLVAGLVEGRPWPLRQGAEALRAVGVSGMTVMPLVGVPLSVLVGGLWGDSPRLSALRGAPRINLPAMFAVWAVAAMILLAAP